MEARLVAGPIALAMMAGACAPSPAPRPEPPPPAASAAPATPARSEEPPAERARPRLVFTFDPTGDHGVPVQSSLEPESPTSFVARDGEEGEIRRSLMRPGPAGDETWYEIETPRGHGFVRDTMVKDVRWVPADGVEPATASAPPRVARAETRAQHRLAHDVQFVETPAPAPIEFAESAPRALGAADVITINASNPGERIDVTQHLVRGRYTVVDFYSERCGPCRKLAPQLAAWSAANPQLAIRTVDIDRRGSNGIDWGSPVAQEYRLRGIPHVQLYDPEGNLVADGNAALSQIEALAHR